MTTINEALTIAFQAHQGQQRKISGAPYIIHILDVVKLLIQVQAPEKVIIAGALHDVLEDTHYPKNKLKKQFGEEVLKLIEYCTEPGNTPDTTDEELLRTWRQRKEQNIKKAKGASDEEVLLKFADTLANLQSLRDDFHIYGEQMWQNFRGGKEGNEWYYTSLGAVFQDRLGKSPLMLLYSVSLRELFVKKKART